jgi:hypothetical protein
MACTVETAGATVKAKAMSSAPSRPIQELDIMANPRFMESIWSVQNFNRGMTQNPSKAPKLV